jgi:hypothetical protein
MFKKILAVTAVLLLVAGLVLAENRMRKTDDLGIAATVQGSLVSLDAEWYLESGGSTYELHFGNRRYLESTGMVPLEGASCTVQGFLDGRELVVSEIEMAGKTFRFRDEEGIPLWAERRNGERGGSGAERRGTRLGAQSRGSGPRNGTGGRHGSGS